MTEHPCGTSTTYSKFLQNNSCSYIDVNPGRLGDRNPQDAGVVGREVSMKYYYIL